VLALNPYARNALNGIAKSISLWNVHKEAFRLRDAGAGKIVMEVSRDNAELILRFIDGLRVTLQVTFEEGTRRPGCTTC